MKGFKKECLRISSLGLITILSAQTHAAGFKLEFQSPSVLADAGDAAVVEDAGTNWYNSAGDVYIPHQVVGAVTDLYSRTSFNGTATAPSITVPGLSTYTSAGRATANNNAILPALHYNFPFYDNRMAVAVSVVPAWGLMEDYGENSLVRYDLVNIYTRTVDIAPSLAVKINDHWSVGLGPDFNYWYLSSKLKVRTEPLTTSDSISRYSTSDWSYGGHIGILYRINEATRIGLNYRSKIVMDMQGYSDFALQGISSFETNQFQVNIAMPPTTTLSVYHDINPMWAIMGSIAYDQWNVIKTLHGQNFMGPTGTTSDVAVPQYYDNTIDISFGTHLTLSPQWMLRGSLKYEPTPTKDAYRDLNFPDAEKLGVNLGARYTMNDKLMFDMIYAHVFTRTESINLTNTFSSNVTGHVNTNMDLAGVQVVYNI